ncbi:MAG: hypothetical protein H6779_02720 [Candidatus Nomurabacteria bacterium]|nr:hypothetical protein [Candidatus Nomurabacteria bacterium]USN87303.1 MAG: hypothetical protein H6779_02720 [Candidatus Nomurabacteria bacterium]
MSPGSPLFLYIVSGVLLGIGFVVPTLWVTVFIGVLVFLVAVSRTETLKSALLGSLITFTIKALFATSMYWSAYPLLISEISLGRIELIIIGLYWMIVSLVIGFGGLLAGAGLWYLKNKHPIKVFLIGLPFILVLSEWLGAFMFSILTYGPGGSINAGYSLGHIGYLLGEHSGLILLAQFGGVYVLSLLAATVGGLVWFIYHSQSKMFFYYTLAFTVIGFGATAHLNWLKVESAEDKTVAIINTKFGGGYRDSLEQQEYEFAAVSKAVAAALETKPDYLVLPEGVGLNPHNLTPKAAYNLFRFNYSDPETVVVFTSTAKLSSEKLTTVRSIIYDGKNKTSWYADKQYLTPQGEFLPYLYTGFLRLFGQTDVLARIDKRSYFKPGPQASQVDFSADIPGILFCYGVVDPVRVRQAVQGRENVPFVAHPFSHAWFHDSKILRSEIDNMLKIQAVWSRVSIISAGNMGEGALYTAGGKKVIPEIIKEDKDWQIGALNL